MELEEKERVEKEHKGKEWGEREANRNVRGIGGVRGGGARLKAFSFPHFTFPSLLFFPRPRQALPPPPRESIA